jgi:glycine/D-amino acid oxidase-like deaminating enzyme
VETSELDRLRAERTAAASAGAEIQAVEASEVVRRVPILAPDRIAGALWTPGDGVIDIHGLTGGLLAEARRGGASIRLGCEVVRLLTRSGRAAGVVTTSGEELTAEAVVNAAGPWAAELGADAGALRLPIRPMRRHLSLLEPTAGLSGEAGDRTGTDHAVDPTWPVVWDLSVPFYFRPESGALLVSACDQDDAPPVVDPEIHARIWSAVRRVAPDLAGARVRRTWACQRALTPDGRFIVGEDPRLGGLYWVAGFGGQGMSAGFEAGRVAAELVHRRSTDYGDALSPARFE